MIRMGKFICHKLSLLLNFIISSGETIEACAKREVFEETGIEAEFISVLSFRHQTEFRYGCADFYFSCLMKPTRPDQPIRLCEQEIGAGQWMEVCIMLLTSLLFWSLTHFLHTLYHLSPLFCFVA